jgi:hypothetical protein
MFLKNLLQYFPPSTPRSSKWSLSFRLSCNNWDAFLFHSCQWLWSSHGPWFHRHWRAQIMKLPIMQFCPPFCYFFRLGSKHSLQQTFLIHRQSTFFLQYQSRAIQNNRQNYSFIYFNLRIIQLADGGGGGQTSLDGMVARIFRISVQLLSSWT